MVVGKNRTVATVVISCKRDEVSAKLIKIISERATSRRGDLGEVPRPAAARAVPPPWYNHTSNETQVVSLLRTQDAGVPWGQGRSGSSGVLAPPREWA